MITACLVTLTALFAVFFYILPILGGIAFTGIVSLISYKLFPIALVISIIGVIAAYVTLY